MIVFNNLRDPICLLRITTIIFVHLALIKNNYKQHVYLIDYKSNQRITSQIQNSLIFEVESSVMVSLFSAMLLGEGRNNTE